MRIGNEKILMKAMDFANLIKKTKQNKTKQSKTKTKTKTARIFKYTRFMLRLNVAHEYSCLSLIRS